MVIPLLKEGAGRWRNGTHHKSYSTVAQRLFDIRVSCRWVAAYLHSF